MDTLWHIYGGEAALRQMQAPRRGVDGVRGLWKMLQRGRVFLELGLIFPNWEWRIAPTAPSLWGPGLGWLPPWHQSLLSLMGPKG